MARKALVKGNNWGRRLTSVGIMYCHCGQLKAINMVKDEYGSTYRYGSSAPARGNFVELGDKVAVG
jgi:hypothetical protein